MLPVLPVTVGVASENDEEERDEELAGARVPEELGAGDESHGGDWDNDRLMVRVKRVVDSSLVCLSSDKVDWGQSSIQEPWQ